MYVSSVCVYTLKKKPKQVLLYIYVLLLFLRENCMNIYHIIKYSLSLCFVVVAYSSVMWMYHIYLSISLFRHSCV